MSNVKVLPLLEPDVVAACCPPLNERPMSAAEAEVAAAADPDTAKLFQQAGPFWQSYAGLRRYWDKKGEATAA